MFEKEAKERVKHLCLSRPNAYVPVTSVEYWQDGAEFGYNKANEWHYVTDGDLPKDKETVLALCIVGGKPYPYLAQYWKDNTKREKDGVDLNWICWRNNLQREVVEPYAWKEIVLPELKESE